MKTIAELIQACLLSCTAYASPSCKAIAYSTPQLELNCVSIFITHCSQHCILISANILEQRKKGAIKKE